MFSSKGSKIFCSVSSKSVPNGTCQIRRIPVELSAEEILLPFEPLKANRDAIRRFTALRPVALVVAL